MPSGFRKTSVCVCVCGGVTSKNESLIKIYLMYLWRYVCLTNEFCNGIKFVLQNVFMFAGWAILPRLNPAEALNSDRSKNPFVFDVKYLSFNVSLSVQISLQMLTDRFSASLIFTLPIKCNNNAFLEGDLKLSFVWLVRNKCCSMCMFVSVFVCVLFGERALLCCQIASCPSGWQWNSSWVPERDSDLNIYRPSCPLFCDP